MADGSYKMRGSDLVIGGLRVTKDGEGMAIIADSPNGQIKIWFDKDGSRRLQMWLEENNYG